MLVASDSPYLANILTDKTALCMRKSLADSRRFISYIIK